jgi:tetratricopeptide (TPR) repeat protein/DNA-binding MarR family transcriptional regulator
MTVSQNERLMLHLLEMDAHREEPEVPLGASQEGIANRLGTQVHNASRALSGLESEGLVMDRLAHVRGAPKRRRAYFLTDKGHRAAGKVRDDLMRSRVVYEERGNAEEVPLAEAVRRMKALAGSGTSFLDLVDIARESDVLRAEEVSRRFVPPSRAERFVEASFGRPKVASFFGREKERKAVVDHIEGDASVMLIWGIPGIGKTSLASKVFDELSGRKHLLWHSFHSWDTEEHFVSVLARFLESANRSSTADAVGRGAAAGDLFAPLVSDLTALDAVLFLDDVQKASENLSVVIAIVLEAVRASGRCKAVLMSRELPPFFSRTAEGNAILELSGLDHASAKEFAQREKAKDPVLAADASRGHPLLLSLMSRGGVGESRGDILSFMDREVSMSLTPAQRAVLEILSIYRHPVPPEAIIDGDDTALVALKDRALVVEQESGVWTHDLLREFFASRLSPERRSALHARAAVYCEGRAGSDWALESMHHYVQAGDHASASRVSVRSFAELAEEFPRETLEYLEQAQSHSAPGPGTPDTLFRMAQLCELLGDDPSATKYYELCLGLLPEGDRPEERALILESLGKLKTRGEEWAESFAAHEKALRIYEESGDSDGQVREWLNIGSAHRKHKDFRKARDAYAEALTIVAKREDRAAQAACTNNLALLDWDEGRLKDAETRLRESVRLAHAVKDHVGEAMGLENLAELLRTQARLSEMTSLVLESSEAFRRAGELEEFKRLQAACAESMDMQGRTDEAVDLCRNALSDPELRRRTGLLRMSARFDRGDVALSVTLVGLLRSSGDLKGAESEIGRLSHIADSMDDQVLRAKAMVELSLVRESSGDLDAASRELAKAESLLRSIGDRRGLVAVSLLLGNMEEKRGDYEAARRRYSEAVRQAESLGDETAVAAATSNLESLDRPVG